MPGLVLVNTNAAIIAVGERAANLTPADRKEHA